MYCSMYSCCYVMTEIRQTVTVSRQRLGKHVPMATNTHAITEEECFLHGPCRDVITRTVGAMNSAGDQFCMGGCEEKSWLQESGCEEKNLCVILGVCNSVRLLQFLR
jgi:hypothetical protein